MEPHFHVVLFRLIIATLKVKKQDRNEAFITKDIKVFTL